MREAIDLLRQGSLYIEIFTAIIATIYYYKYKNSPLKFMVYFLWYIVLNEFLGLLLKELNAGKHNDIIYNIYGIVSFVFLLNLYRLSLKKEKFKKYVSFFIISSIIIYLITAFFVDFNTSIMTIPYVYGSLVLIISIVFYFIEILNSERILLVSKDILFWISVGLFIFQIGIIPFMIMRELYVASTTVQLNIILLLYYVLIYLLNICYIIGFIWSHKMEQHKELK